MEEDKKQKKINENIDTLRLKTEKDFLEEMAQMRFNDTLLTCRL